MSVAGTGGSSAGSSGSAGTNAAAGSGGAGGAGVVTTLTDAQIASIALTANMGEIEQGMLATAKAQAPSVVALAQTLVQMHTTAEQRENTLNNTLNLTPADNAVSAQLRSASADAVSKLNGASAATFDAVYLQSQIDAHQMVLDLIDTQLLPSVQNAALRAELLTLRGEVATHLGDARSVAASLSLDLDAGI